MAKKCGLGRRKMRHQNLKVFFMTQQTVSALHVTSSKFPDFLCEIWMDGPKTNFSELSILSNTPHGILYKRQ